MTTAIKIDSIQRHNNDQTIEANRIRMTFQNLLMQVANTIGNQNASYLRLALVSGEEEVPSVEVFFICFNAPQVLPLIQQVLYDCQYQFSVLAPKDCTVLQRRLNDILSSESIAIVKAEQEVLTQSSATGYYYYTTPFFCDGNQLIDYYSEIYNTLALCRNTTVCLDLFPTQYESTEIYAFRDLTNTLVGLSSYDPTITNPFSCYQYYNERLNNGLFTHNILVGSKSSNADRVANQVSVFLQNVCSSQPVGIELLTLTEFYNHLSKTVAREELPFCINDLLMTGLEEGFRDQVIWNNSYPQYVPPENLWRLPYLVTPEEAAVFFRLPLGDNQMKAMPTHIIPQNSSSISSKAIVSNENRNKMIVFGHCSIGPNCSQEIGIPINTWARHGMIVGMPGTGKTTFALDILLQFAKKGIPFLAIEPTKKEYRSLIDKIPNLQVITPGNDGIYPLRLNPFLPPKGVNVSTYKMKLLDAFKAAFAMEDTLERLFTDALNQCYIQYGWRDDSKAEEEGTKPFGLHEFILIFKKLMNSPYIKYRPEDRAHIETAGLMRLMSLIEMNASIFDTVRSISIEAILTKPTVIEMNAILNDDIKTIIMALLLAGVNAYSSMRGGTGNLQNIILIDEAHILLDTGNESEHARQSRTITADTIARMIAEMRGQGTGIILADQRPTVLSCCIANVDNKVVFCLSEKAEREKIAASMSMSDSDAEYLSQLKTGQAYVYSSSYWLAEPNYPLLVSRKDMRKENGIELDIPDDALVKKLKYRNMHQKPFIECKYSSCDFCDNKIRYFASFTAANYLKKVTERGKNGRLDFQSLISQSSDSRKKYDCCAIHFYRISQLKAPFHVKLSNPHQSGLQVEFEFPTKKR